MLKVSIIRKRNGKYVILSHDGKKTLGTYDTREEAVHRLRQIEYFKHHSSSKLAYEDAKMDLYGDLPKKHIDGDPDCEWCEEPSTSDNRVIPFPTQITKYNGVYVRRHKKCQEEANKYTEFNPVENYIAASRKIAVYPTLVCDNPHCEDTADPGDDNETDGRQAVGETCWNCGRGQLEYRVAGGITNPYSDPSRGQGALQRFPMSPEPSAPMEQGAPNLDPNQDGTTPRSLIPRPPGEGDIPGMKVQGSSSYSDLRSHLIKGHGYKAHWITGYNPKQLISLHEMQFPKCDF